ncbi:sensor protein (plasmid) [Scytonema sp. HK-05]|uniref:Tll0287-like domain-containing protein n=1 Tax=Scytonema sp. HK-05 TaxID=1137095 RepID=UPI00093592D8|nr:DUF3365 domain-containing protein [Scytonema sp. HK-05]OKH57075.1 histidine kinase [Scytonema sp. HK-05]BAY50274.1 sensor protein [Scytonema sp. HK-05]
MLGNLKLATKFTLFLGLVFIIAILISGFALSKALEQKAKDEISYRGQILIQMINSVRNYTDVRVAPLLESDLKTDNHFIPEAIPTFAARQVFENLRQNKEYINFFYKDATLNPTNLADKADDFETDVIESFQNQPDLSSLSGFRTMFGEQLFYSAKPFSITNSSCLQCHSDPARAPKSQLATYGRDHGYGWKLNEILGTQIIYIPASQVYASAHQAFSLFIGIFIAVFTLVILLINYLLKWNVIQPIKPMAQLAQKLSTDTINSVEAEEFERKSLGAIAKRTDELGQLGRVFQRMVREVYAREQRLKQQVQALRIEIDQAKKARQVEEIADSEYFQKLRQNAQELRNKWSDESKN